MQHDADKTLPTPPSRLELLHVSVFALGVSFSTAGVISNMPRILAAGGACLMCSALFTWLGWQIRLSGVVGEVIRTVLGQRRITSLYVGTAFWFTFGFILTTWGVVRWTNPPDEEERPALPANLSQR
ncbi:MAG: hypothetical protein RL701_4771 [Pseudomonadota bacterium]|jgi:hypothetical protein